jgi:hypothetical protein
MSSSQTPDEATRLLARAPAISNACSLDLLMFLHRHPRAFLTSENLAAFVGYDIKQVAKALDALVDAELVERTLNPMHAARMFRLVPHDLPDSGLNDLISMASTRQGRRNLLHALERTSGSRKELSSVENIPQLKIA